MHIATANLYRASTNPGSDIRKVFNQLPAPLKTVVLWQEVRPDHPTLGNFHDIIQANDPADSYHAFSNLPQAMTIPTDRFEVLQERWAQTLAPQDPDPITGEADPARYWSAVKLRAKWRSWPTNHLWVLNTHFTHGSNWDNPTPTPSELLRRARWEEHFDQVKAELTRIRDLGDTVFWGGDFNRQKTMPEFFPNEEQAVGHASVDKLYVLDHNLNIGATEMEDGVIDLTYSDHDAKWVRWDLTP